MAVRFVVDLSESYRKILKVKMFLKGSNEVVSMPVWAPGSYLVRDYSRNISSISVEDGTMVQLDKTTWSVTSNTDEIALSYEIYADDLSVQGTYADDSLVLLNGTSIFLYPRNAGQVSYEVELLNYGDRNISTGMRKEGELYEAENYDQLVDSPILISRHSIERFDALGKKHTVAIHGFLNHDKTKFVEDLRKIVISEGGIFGSLPYENYTFIVVLLPDDIYGGLEHKNSTVIFSNQQNIVKDFDYKNFLSIFSHEFFHTWNVKRIRPKTLGPFDYSKENYTDMLWFSEGFTSYYEWLTLWRAGIVNEKEYFEHLAEMINYYRFIPGHNTPASLSSFNTWTKLYKPNGDIINSYVSYYLKGELIAFALNIHILRESSGSISLDDVFRALYADYVNRNRGITYRELKEFINKTLKKNIDKFVDDLVTSSKELDFENYLKSLSYGFKYSFHDGNKVPSATTGIVIQNNSGKYTVSGVIKGYPAHDAGINAGDELVSINGTRFSDNYTREFSKEMKRFKIDDLKESRPGDEIILHIFRKNVLREIHMNAVEEPKWMNLEKAGENALIDKILRG